MIPKIEFYQKLHKYEISCVLFDVCNLKCKFCFETSKSKTIDIQYIKTIPDILITNLKDTIRRDKLDIEFINVMFWGGEVFFDGISDNIFDVYRSLIDDITRKIKAEYNDVKLQFSWLSNGVFTKFQRVVNLLTSYDNHVIGFSYDPVNRFSSPKQKQIMLDNVRRFKQLNLCDKVSITLTKPNIEFWLNDCTDLQWFRDIGVNIDVNYYIANPNWHEMLANDQLIYQFYKMLLDKQLFNVVVLQKILQYNTNTTIEKFCDCHQCSQITKGVWSVDCATRSSSLSRVRFYGKYSDDINEQTTNPIKASIGLIKRGCLTCQYYNRCQMPCWISILFDQYQCEQCPYQRVYQYIEQNPQIINAYKQTDMCWI